MANLEPNTQGLVPFSHGHDERRTTVHIAKGTRKWRLELSRLINDRGDMLYVDENGVPDALGRTVVEVAIDNAWRVAARGHDKDAIAAFKALGELGYGRPEYKSNRDVAMFIIAEANRLGIDPRDDPQWGPLLAATGYEPARTLITAGRPGTVGEEEIEGTGSPDAAGMDAEELP